MKTAPLLAALLALGCGGTVEERRPQPPALRVVNALSDPATVVTLEIDGAAVGTLANGTGFPSGSDLQTLTAGVHAIRFRDAAGATIAELPSGRYREDDLVTLVLAGEPATARVIGATDRRSITDLNRAEIRVVNALTTTTEPLDIFLTPTGDTEQTTPTISGLAPFRALGPFRLNEGSYRVRVALSAGTAVLDTTVTIPSGLVQLVLQDPAGGTPRLLVIPTTGSTE